MRRLRTAIGSLLILPAAAVHAQGADIGAALPPDALLPGWQSSATKDGLVPDRYWGASLKALHPIRIYRDRVNVAVVLAETANDESGVYFVVPESSYLPVDSPGRSFRRRPDRDELWFTFSRQPAER
ncbi:MAG TPA: hypothetical protein VM847_09155 [Tahibacter sp.]|nr:hypothetical protein [Tahibacter sp.]